MDGPHEHSSSTRAAIRSTVPRHGQDKTGRTIQLVKTIWSNAPELRHEEGVDLHEPAAAAAAAREWWGGRHDQHLQVRLRFLGLLVSSCLPHTLPPPLLSEHGTCKTVTARLWQVKVLPTF